MTLATPCAGMALPAVVIPARISAFRDAGHYFIKD
jgi:hypothetical protein